MSRGRMVLATLAVVVAAVVGGTTAPTAAAWTCGSSVFYTNQTSYGANETITVDVWDGAPAPGGVQIGSFGWSKISQTNYPDHISTRWTHAFQAKGTYDVWVNISGSSCRNADGQFKIV